jgi:hypothetical protein
MFGDVQRSAGQTSMFANVRILWTELLNVCNVSVKYTLKINLFVYTVLLIST